MKDLIQQFPTHLLEALEIGKTHRFKPHKKQIRNVVVAGLGGSGIGGTIVSNLVADSCEIPISILNDYTVPAFVSKRTLFIACSYSGNTEETISAITQAIRNDAEVAVITSGGFLERIADEKDLNAIMIPSGYPPRAAFGLSSVALLYALYKYVIIKDTFIYEIETIAKFLQSNQEKIASEAKAIAEKIKGTTPIIYADTSHAGVAVRLRQQINENAKILCWHHVFPEMNHNELVGWAGANDQFSVIMLRTQDDHPRSQIRMDLCKGIFENYTNKIFEINAHGETMMQRAYYLVHIGDWLSYYLSEEYQVDPIEVKVIDYLKSELAKHEE